MVWGTRDDLVRLAINLIENALRHTPPGTRITVHTGSVGDLAAELVVQDDGPGVPPEIAARLFERFVRGAGDRGGSSGLGLAIVRVVARAHGGDVQLQQPAQGTGARFVVEHCRCSCKAAGEPRRRRRGTPSRRSASPRPAARGRPR